LPVTFRRACQVENFLHATAKVIPPRSAPRGAGSPYNDLVSAVHAGLYISLNQCSLSKGLEHRPVSVNISRQMIPTPVLTSPT